MRAFFIFFFQADAWKRILVLFCFYGTMALYTIWIMGGVFEN